MTSGNSTARGEGALDCPLNRPAALGRSARPLTQVWMVRPFHDRLSRLGEDRQPKTATKTATLSIMAVFEDIWLSSKKAWRSSKSVKFLRVAAFGAFVGGLRQFP